MEIDKAKYIEIIKAAYVTDFGRSITEEEAVFIFDTVSKHMRDELGKLSDFSEEMFARYMNNNGLTLTYSPACVYSEINLALKTVGESTFSSSRDYKRTREMEIAARMCLALKKQGNGGWMIKVQDNPDIVIFRINNSSIKSTFMDAIQIEIMTIPEVEKKQWDNNHFMASLLKFIREKKFKKRYGLCALMVRLDFNQQGVDFTKVSNLLSAVKSNNPYEKIFITAITSQDLKTVSVMQIHPIFSKTDFDIEEPGLLY